MTYLLKTPHTFLTEALRKWHSSLDSYVDHNTTMPLCQCLKGLQRRRTKHIYGRIACLQWNERHWTNATW